MAIEPRPKHPILDANGNITIAWDLWFTLISVNAGGEGVATLPLSHTNIAHITNVGANTHAQIDAHLANTSNPHSVTLAQVGGTLDHGSLNGLSDDDHTQYILVDGSRDFTGSQNAQNILPVTDSTYDLGSSSVFWRTIYTDDIIAKAPHADVRAFGATGDGSTDDLTAIEAARDAAGVGGTVYFPVGTYRVSAIVWCNVQDQTWLFDNGADIKPADSGHTDVAILRCDATTGVVIDNATINGNSANTGLATGIIMSTDGTVKNCTIDDTGNYGIIGNNQSNLLIKNNRLSNVTNTGVWIQNLADTSPLIGITVVDNHIDLTDHNPASSIVPGINVRGTITNPNQDVEISRNTVLMSVEPVDSNVVGLGTGWTDGFVCNDNYTKNGAIGISSPFSRNGTISGNSCDGANFYAIELAGEAGANQEAVSVIGNTADGQGVMSYAIAIHGTANTVANIAITGNSIKGCVDHGILVVPNQSHISIVGNTIDCDVAGLDNGIVINQSTNILISGNLIRGQSNVTNGIRLVDNTTKAVITSNYIDDASVGLLLEATTLMDFVTVTGNTLENCTTPINLSGTAHGENFQVVANTGFLRNGAKADILDVSNDVIRAWGTGTPESVVTAGVGSMYLRDDGGANTTLYIKESGTGNTGWVATGAAAGLWEVSGGNTQLIIPDDINFQNLKAIAMACDNGATLPTSGLVNGQWFLHTPTGREILYMYSSTDAEWKPIMSIGDITVFVDKTDGTDALTHGQAINTNAFATIQFAFDSLPPLICGNVIININGEAYIEDTKYRGRIICGAYTIRIVGTMTETLGETTATGGTAGDGTTQGTLVVSGAGWGVGTVEESGTTDGTTANKLIESGQNFTTTVGVGMVVYNTTDTTQAHVTTVDSDTQLSLSADIMVSGEAYQIGWGEHTNLLIRFEADTTTAALRGMSFRIDSNTSDTLVAYGAFFSNAPVSGDTFKILSHNTTLTNNTTTDRAIGVFNGQKGLVFEDIEFNDKAGSTGVDSDGTSYQVDDGAEATFKYCKFEPNATGAVLYFVSFGVATMLECFLNDGRTGGARMAGAKDGGGKLTIKHCKVNGHPTTGWGFYGQNNGTLIYAQAIAEDCNWGFLALNMGLVTSTGTSAVNGGTYVRNNDNGAHASSFSFVADTLMIFDNNTTDRDFPAGNTDPSVIS